MISGYDDAVSEVVGVLLMLTVTIIMVSVAAVAVSSSVGDVQAPVTADVAAVDVSGGSVTLELQSGDPVSLNDVEVRVGVRENVSAYAVLRNSGADVFLRSYTGRQLVELGDRFFIAGVRGDEGISFGECMVPFGCHLTYRFYGKDGRPFSSGEILVR